MDINETVDFNAVPLIQINFSFTNSVNSVFTILGNYDVWLTNDWAFARVQMY